MTSLVFSDFQNIEQVEVVQATGFLRLSPTCPGLRDGCGGVRPNFSVCNDSAVWLWLCTGCKKESFHESTSPQTMDS